MCPPSGRHAMATALPCPDHNAAGGSTEILSGDWSGKERAGYPSALEDGPAGAVETRGNRAIGISRNLPIGTSGRPISGHPKFPGDHPERYWGLRGVGHRSDREGIAPPWL